MPHKLGFKIVKAFKPGNFTLSLPGGKINITEYDVAEVLGFPHGDKIIDLTSKNPERSDAWSAQFGLTKSNKFKVSAKMVVDAIEKEEAVTELLKLNFMMIIYNCLVEAPGTPFLNKKMLNFTGSLDELSTYNWPSLVLRSLADTKDVWEADPATRMYTGPLLFLIILYVDRVNYKGHLTVQRSIPTWLAWSDSKLREKGAVEIGPGVFGNGVILKGQWELKADKGKTVDQVQSPHQPNASLEAPPDTQESIMEYDKVEQALMSSLEKYAFNLMDVIIKYNGYMQSCDSIIPTNPRLKEIDKLVFDQIARLYRPHKEAPTEHQGEPSSHAHPAVQDVQPLQHEQFAPDKPISTPTEGPTFNFAEGPTFNLLTQITPQKDQQPDTVAAKGVAIPSMPSFDLLSQQTPENPHHDEPEGTVLSIARQYKDDTTNVADQVPPSTSDVATKSDAGKGPVAVEFIGYKRRQMKPGPDTCSPYIQRIVQLNTKSSPIEKRLSDWVKIVDEDTMAIVFRSGDIMCTIWDIKSLCDRTELSSGVIDTWSYMLNNAEATRSPTSPLRFYFHVTDTFFFTSKKESKCTDALLEQFVNTIKHRMSMFPTLNINDVTLAVFPIHHAGHYYVICFNLKQPAIEILDNSRVDVSIKDKYQHVPPTLRCLFSKFLMDINHPAGIALSTAEFVRLPMPWRTYKNPLDCGIFVMRHMETYLSGGLKNWDTGLGPENRTQVAKLTRLRGLYLEKILTSDLNELKDEILTQSREVERAQAPTTKRKKG